MDAESNHGLLAMTNANVDHDPTNEQWNINGRICWVLMAHVSWIMVITPDSLPNR